MIKPRHEPDSLADDPQELTAGGKMRRRILRSTALLPAMFTVGNGLCGFASIYFATKVEFGSANVLADKAVSYFPLLAVAAWLIVAAMICDMLDGRLARMTRKTSDFGAQLDSLSDAISFGVAPAILMLRAVAVAMHQVGADPMLNRVVICVAGLYVACATLRLARFNVENTPDESAHMNFSGLPSPGAAANVAALVLLFEHAYSNEWLRQWWMYTTVSIVLPLVTAIVALLMVSRIRYPHLVNQYIRGKKPFNYLVKIVIVVVAMWLDPFLSVAAMTLFYTLWGPLRAGWRRFRPTPAEGTKAPENRE